MNFLIILLFTAAECVYPIYFPNSGNVRPLWRPVTLNSSLLQGTDASEIEHHFNYQRQQTCLQQCATTLWCHLWCFDGSECIISKILVSPLYQEAELDSTLTKSCYTSRSKDFAAQAQSFSSGISSNFVDRVVSKLVDGLYRFDMTDCYISSRLGYLNYAVFDFNKELPISKLVVFSQPNAVILQVFWHINIYLSNSFNQELLDNGDFTDFYQVGQFGKPVTAGGHHTIRIEPPVFAPYVLFRKTDHTHFQFCHIEIY